MAGSTTIFSSTTDQEGAMSKRKHHKLPPRGKNGRFKKRK
jgi:hypothetical protein